MLWFAGNVSQEFQDYCESTQTHYKRFTPVSAKADGVSVFYADFSSRDALRESLRNITLPTAIDGICVSGYEQFVLPASWIAEYYQVPFLKPAAAVRATDKLAMRQAFYTTDPAITPPFAEVTSWHDIEQFVAAQGYPVMLKPANLMKSLFISRNDSLDSLRRNYNHMLSALPEIYEKQRLGEPRILIESCMTGIMHTVAGFVSRNGDIQLLPSVTDCQTAHDIGKDDTYLFSRTLPSKLDQAQQAVIIQVAEAGVRALGITATAIHAELMLTDDGPKIIEIAARIGGFRSYMYESAYGISMVDCAINTALGRPIELSPKRRQSAAVLELFPDTAGRYAGIKGLPDSTAFSAVKDVRYKTSSGDRIGPASAGYRAPVVIYLTADSQAEITRLTDTLRRDVSVLVN